MRGECYAAPHLSPGTRTRRWISTLWAAGAAAAIIVAAPAGSGQETTPAPSSPKPVPAEQASGNDRGVLILIRSTLLALAHANATGNYTVLRDLGAPGFQAVNTAARLSEIFSNLRAQHLDLSYLAVLEPQLTTPPQRDARGFLRIDGTYPSTMPQFAFSLVFEPVDGQWRLFGISLNTGQAAGVSAPPPPTAPAPVAPNPAKPEGSQPTPAATPESSKPGTARPKK